MRVAYAVFRIAPSRAPALLAFYREKLGLTVRGEDTFSYVEGAAWRRIRLNYATRTGEDPWASSTGIELAVAPTELAPYCPGPRNLYWKIGLAVDSVDATLDAVFPGVEKRPRQFLDVGYLIHVRDPAGFAVELLQTTFEDDAATRREFVEDGVRARGGDSAAAEVLGVAGSSHAGRASPVIGQITTRTNDVERSRRFYEEAMGLKLVCVETVEEYGFVLNFYADGSSVGEPPEASSLKAVANRPWTYRLPVTTLEVQGPLEEAGGPLAQDPDSADGFWGLVLQRRAAAGEAECVDRLEDPDGVRILVEHVAP